MEIKAIETQYNGYHFRSRLEARWAVFFDTLGVRWEYEKEGYELETGERYLPDFWLPDERIWIEVKGDMPQNNYLSMIEAFSWEIGAILLVVGLPGTGPYEFFGFDLCDSSGGGYRNEIDISGAHDGKIQFTSQDSRLTRDRVVFTDGRFENSMDIMYFRNRIIFPSAIEATNKAKAARFEYLSSELHCGNVKRW
jgi:hypothetical protein